MNSVTFEEALSEFDKNPNVEYLLQGTILNTAVELLIERLKELCDNDETNVENFRDLEVCFSLEISNQQPLHLRMRKGLSLDTDSPFLLRYIGQPEVTETQPTLIRSTIEAECSETILDFLTDLGCQCDLAYTSKGIMFRKGNMIITVSRLFKNAPDEPEEPQDLPNALLTESHLVEVSVITPNADDAIGEDMKTFAEQLQPLVNLEKIDYKFKVI